MKKFLVVLFGLVLTLGLTACGGDGDSNVPFDDATSVQNARTVALTTVGQSGEAAKVAVDVVGTVSAIVMGYYNNEMDAKGYYITDKTATIYVHDYNTAPSVNVGDCIKLEAIGTNYNGGVQLTAPTITETYSTGNKVNLTSVIKGKTLADMEINGLTGDDLTAKVTEVAGNIYELTGTLEQNSFGAYSLTSEAGSVGVYVSGSKDGCLENAYDDMLKAHVGQEITIAFAVNGTNSGKTSLRGNVVAVL